MNSKFIKKNRLLWIAYIFPPYGGTQGLRMKKYLEYLFSLMNKKLLVDIITIKPYEKFPQFDSSLSLDLPNVNIYRVSPTILHKIRYKFDLDNKKGLLVRVLITFINMIWILPAIWCLMKLWMNKYRYQAIYCFADPFSSIIVAFIAKKLFKCKCVIEYGDPWAIKPSTSKNLSFLKKIGTIIENRVLRETDTVIVRTKSVVDAYSDIYELSRNKFKVLYGGVTLEEYNAIKTNKKYNKSSERFIITYTGTIYEDSIDVLPFFEAVRNLINMRIPIQVLIIGERNIKIEEIVKGFGVESNIHFKGHIPYKDVIYYQKNATILLAFGCKTPYKIPSKLAQYVAAKRPILLIVENDNDPSKEFVLTNKRGLVAYNQTDMIEKTIKIFFDLWKNKTLDDMFDLSDMEEISFSYIVTALKRILINA